MTEKGNALKDLTRDNLPFVFNFSFASDEFDREIWAFHSFQLHRPLSGVCSFLFYGYILHWQGRIPLFLKSNATSMEKRPPDKKHKKDLGKII